MAASMSVTLPSVVCGHTMRFILILLAVSPAICWDTEDFEIFDVVEEIGQNFYELIGTEKTAKTADIKRAYRKLSLALHPDRNKADDAEEKFRQINAVYEILKDEDKRKRYDNVLENGLPDWKQPVFYYRRARKMGLLEFAVLLLLILTIGQFLVVWSMYFEKKFELEEVFKSVKKKKDKKSRRGNQVASSEEEDEVLKQTLDAVPKPKMSDLLPCWMIRTLIYSVMSFPRWLMEFKEFIMNKINPPNFQDVEEEDEDEEEEIRRKKRRRMVVTPDADFVPEMAPSSGPVVYTAAPVSRQSGDDKEHKKKAEGEWSNEELSLLSKATTKFPGGTPQRWEKVAEFVGRSVTEVTAKSKQLKSSFAMSVDPSAQGIIGGAAVLKKGTGISDQIISTRDNFSSEQQITNTHTKHKDRTKVTKDGGSKSAESSAGVKTSTPTLNSNPAMGNKPSDADVWTQNQQKLLEWALSIYPKTDAERWEKIASHIQGKTKEECILRFKHLADIIKKKKVPTATLR